MMSVAELLSRAKRAIESGETSLRAAAEDIAAAKEQGATQREIAQAVGMSVAWVNRLLKWCESGYQDATPFGPQAKAGRQRAKRVQATEQRNERPEQAQAAAARARAETAKAEASKAKADAAKARSEASKAKADAAKAKADTQAAREKAKAKTYDFFRGEVGGNASEKKVHSGPRELLVKALGMLGSDQAGERASAALFVATQRAKLGLTWDELIIPADDAEARAA
jgi:hypothetical protein